MGTTRKSYTEEPFLSSVAYLSTFPLLRSMLDGSLTRVFSCLLSGGLLRAFAQPAFDGKPALKN